MQAVAHKFGLPGNVVKTAQEADKFCQSLKPSSASSKSEYFKDEEGLIFRRRINGEHQLVVPLSLTQVIKMNHNPTVAHPGMSCTLDILCLRFYWTGMRRHVEEYVKNSRVSTFKTQARVQSTSRRYGANSAVGSRGH